MSKLGIRKSEHQQLVDNWADKYRVDAEFIGYLVSELQKGIKLREADIFQSYFEIRTWSRINDSKQLLNSSDPQMQAFGKSNLSELQANDLVVINR